MRLNLGGFYFSCDLVGGQWDEGQAFRVESSWSGCKHSIHCLSLFDIFITDNRLYLRVRVVDDQLLNSFVGNLVRSLGSLSLSLSCWDIRGLKLTRTLH